MSREQLAQQQELALVDAATAWAESERDRLEQLWSRAKPGSRRDRDLLAELHELDLEIAGLTTTRHRLVCAMRGERHLKAI